MFGIFGFIIMKIQSVLGFIVLAIGVQSYWDVGHMLTAAVAEIKLKRDDP